MDISSTFIRDYLLGKFKNNNYRINGSELVIESIFVENDRKRHMSINLDTGKWQCFKSGEKGSFIYLYSLLEEIPYYEAKNKFLVEAFFNEDKEPEKPFEAPKLPSIAELFKDFQEIKILDMFTASEKIPTPESSAMVLARNYLRERKLYYTRKFYVAETGPFANRLIIPYMNWSTGAPFFFQAREIPQLTKNTYAPKYLNPKNLRFSDILYPFDMESEEPLIICEGVMDALSVSCGSCFQVTSTGSCNVSIAQMEQLKLYRGKLVFAYDNDSAGRKGLLRAEKIRRKLKLPPIHFTVPPINRKDWNDVLCRDGENAVFSQVSDFKEFDALEFFINEELNTWDL